MFVFKSAHRGIYQRKTFKLVTGPRDAAERMGICGYKWMKAFEEVGFVECDPGQPSDLYLGGGRIKTVQNTGSRLYFSS